MTAKRQYTARRDGHEHYTQPFKPAKLNAAKRDVDEQDTAWAEAVADKPLREGYCPQCRIHRLSRADVRGICMFCEGK